MYRVFQVVGCPLGVTDSFDFPRYVANHGLMLTTIPHFWEREQHLVRFLGPRDTYNPAQPTWLFEVVHWKVVLCLIGQSTAGEEGAWGGHSFCPSRGWDGFSCPLSTPGASRRVRFSAAVKSLEWAQQVECLRTGEGNSDDGSPLRSTSRKTEGHDTNKTSAPLSCRAPHQQSPSMLKGLSAPGGEQYSADGSGRTAPWGASTQVTRGHSRSSPSLLGCDKTKTLVIRHSFLIPTTRPHSKQDEISPERPEPAADYIFII